MTVARHKTKTSKKRVRGPVRFPGICAAADELGVNRVTLYRALTGKWRLPGLVQRYRQLLNH